MQLQTCILTILTCGLSHIGLVNSGAILRVRMMTFRNDNERDYTGACCDWSCTGQCDPTFMYCVDNYNGLRNFMDCPFYSAQTGYYDSQNVVIFGAVMQGLDNPLVVKFDEWKGGAMLKIRVQDDDTGHSGPDDMDDFFFSFSAQPARGRTEALWTQYMLTGSRIATTPTNIWIRIMLYCEENYYGQNCSTFCLPRNTGLGHYWCDPSTGNIICRTGWTNKTSLCTEPIDVDPNTNMCVREPCEHDSYCRLKGNGYECLCVPGYTGSNCDKQMTPMSEGQEFPDINNDSVDIPYTPEGLPMWIIAMIIVVIVASVVSAAVYCIVKKSRQKKGETKALKSTGAHNPVYEDSTQY